MRALRTTATAVTSVLLLFAAVGPVSAQPSPSGPGEAPGYAKPPPLPPGTPVPPDTGKPDVPYALKTQCVVSLNRSIDLINKPWGQVQP